MTAESAPDSGRNEVRFFSVVRVCRRCRRYPSLYLFCRSLLLLPLLLLPFQKGDAHPFHFFLAAIVGQFASSIYFREKEREKGTGSMERSRVLRR